MQCMHIVLKRTGHVIRMPEERLTKKFSMANYIRKGVLKVARRNAIFTKTFSKPL